MHSSSSVKNYKRREKKRTQVKDYEDYEDYELTLKSNKEAAIGRPANGLTRFHANEYSDSNYDSDDSGWSS